MRIYMDMNTISLETWRLCIIMYVMLFKMLGSGLCNPTSIGMQPTVEIDCTHFNQDGGCSKVEVMYGHEDIYITCKKSCSINVEVLYYNISKDDCNESGPNKHICELGDKPETRPCIASLTNQDQIAAIQKSKQWFNELVKEVNKTCLVTTCSLTKCPVLKIYQITDKPAANLGIHSSGIKRSWTIITMVFPFITLLTVLFIS